MEADGDWVAYLDDDVIVDRWWFEGLQEAWRENQDASAITGLVMPLELRSRAQILFEKREGFRRGFDKRRYAASLPENPLYPCGAGIFGAGCNMAFRRDVLRDLGGFDDALDTGASLPGGGDLDMFYRVIRTGGVLVYEPSYMVFHEHRHFEADLQRQYFSWGLGFMAFVGKHLRSSGEHKDRFRSLTRWWVRDQLRQLKASLRGRHPLPPRMILAEISGGIIGISGEYRRSCKRIEVFVQSLMSAEHRWEVRQVNLEEPLPGMEARGQHRGDLSSTLVAYIATWPSLVTERVAAHSSDRTPATCRPCGRTYSWKLFICQRFPPALPTIVDNPARDRHPDISSIAALSSPLSALEKHLCASPGVPSRVSVLVCTRAALITCEDASRA